MSEDIMLCVLAFHDYDHKLHVLQSWGECGKGSYLISIGLWCKVTYFFSYCTYGISIIKYSFKLLHGQLFVQKRYLIFTTMIIGNGFYFQVDVVKIGPVEFTLQSVFVSVVSTAIVFPISFIVVTIFRKTRPKPNKLQQSNQVQSSNKYGWKTLSGQ